jgi:hypothetical protein
MNGVHEIEIQAAIKKIRKQEATVVVVFALLLGILYILRSWVVQIIGIGNDQQFHGPLVVMELVLPWVIVFSTAVCVFTSEKVVSKLKEQISGHPPHLASAPYGKGRGFHYKEINTTWITQFASVVTKDSEQANKIFVTEMSKMGSMDLSYHKHHLSSHILSLKSLRSPFSTPKLLTYLVATVVAIVLYQQYSNIYLSILPVAVVMLMALMDWRNTSKYIMGYQSLLMLLGSTLRKANQENSSKNENGTNMC